MQIVWKPRSKLCGNRQNLRAQALMIYLLNIESLLGQIETSDIWRVETPWLAIVTEAGLVEIKLRESREK